MIVDIGGGSTELILPDRHTSLDVGCVRLTERFGEDADAAGAFVGELLPAAGPSTPRSASPERSPRWLRSISAWSTTTPSASTATCSRPPPWTSSFGRLASLPLEERRRLPGLEPERAPVIVAGAAILREVLRRYELSSIEASEHDLLHGVALAAAELPAPDEDAVPPGAYTCC